MLLWLLLACAPSPDKEPDTTCDPGALEEACGCSAPTLEIGDGNSTFTPLYDGDPVTMIHGPQGGWHVMASIRALNTHPIVTIDYAVEVPAEGVLAAAPNTLKVMLAAEEECAGIYWNIQGVLDAGALGLEEGTAPWEHLAGKELRLTMDVVDMEGRAVSASVTTLATPDPVDVGGDTGG